MSLTVAAGGIHPTTESCIAALQWLHPRAECANILEIGCGSGVLSVIAADIWQAPVLAADMVPKAVADTAELAQRSGLEGRITAIRSEGFRHELIGSRAPYDLIICNLVAATLIGLAADVKKHLAPGGTVLLSGILAWLAEDVETAYKSCGLNIIWKNSSLSWNSYLLCHEGETKEWPPVTKA